MPDSPQRLHYPLRRKWDRPANTRIVIRGTRWGNPWAVPLDGDAATCVAKYVLHLSDCQGYRADARRLLKGKHLACTCKAGEPCHGDVLLGWANEDV